MKFYPCSPEKDTTVEIPEITEAQRKSVYTEIIRLMEEGAPKNHFPNKETVDGPISREGEELSQHQIVAITTKNVFNDREYYFKVLEIYKHVLKDRQDLFNVQIKHFNTAAEFKSALSEVSSDIDSTLWFQGLLAEYGVSTFAELKEKLTSTEGI